MHGLLKVGRLPSYAAFGTSPRFTSRGPVGGPPVSFGRMSCREAQGTRRQVLHMRSARARTEAGPRPHHIIVSLGLGSRKREGV